MRIHDSKVGIMQDSVYIFGWPRLNGGANTKLYHLLKLIHRDFNITVIPDSPDDLKDKVMTSFLDRLNVKYTLLKHLPDKLTGVGFGMCNEFFFSQGIAEKAKARGLFVIWSNEMMWLFPGEEEAVKRGSIDRVLYCSDFQRQALEKYYLNLPSLITGNYIDPLDFPYLERKRASFTIGRLSRADPVKYPVDFPVFYQCLKLPEARFRVMGWNDALRKQYRWFRFGPHWDLLPERKERTVNFLGSLDLFVYPLGPWVKESWGRAVVEGMLTGAIPLVPKGHFFEKLMVHEESGFICETFDDYKYYANVLFDNYPLRAECAKRCSQHASSTLCNPAEHLGLWKEAFKC